MVYEDPFWEYYDVVRYAQSWEFQELLCFLLGTRGTVLVVEEASRRLRCCIEFLELVDRGKGYMNGFLKVWTARRDIKRCMNMMFLLKVKFRGRTEPTGLQKQNSVTRSEYLS